MEENIDRAVTAAQRKKQLRTKIRKMEQELSTAYRCASEQAIIQTVIHMEKYSRANCVFCFVGGKREIDTSLLLMDILARGKQLCVPLCISEGIMELREITSLEQLKPGTYGILEPSTGTMRVDPYQVDLSIIPCVSCDHSGHRLGQGGGYYDRFFHIGTDNTVMLCRERLISSDIPVEEFDQVFPVVVTEWGTYQNGFLCTS